MKPCFGIRREDKNEWERRAPLTPYDLAGLLKNNALECVVQPSTIRIFPDEAYREAGAQIREDLSSCRVVFGVKEFPAAYFSPGGTYMFFSHVIKGQTYNMPMLKKLLDLKCQLIDYERVEDEKNRRLIFFGPHAGLAGMIETFAGLGGCFKEIDSNPFREIKNAYRYESLEAAKQAVARLGEKILNEGLPGGMAPFITGFAGYGHVSQGAQEIYDILPVQEIDPTALTEFYESGSYDDRTLYKVVFKEQHLVEPLSPSDLFELQDYYDHPDKYRGVFSRYTPMLSVLMNCTYWDDRYPRLVTKEDIKKLYHGGPPRLRMIGDISCDINGSIEFTDRVTTPSDPVFV